MSSQTRLPTILLGISGPSGLLWPDSIENPFNLAPQPLDSQDNISKSQGLWWDRLYVGRRCFHCLMTYRSAISREMVCGKAVYVTANVHNHSQLHTHTLYKCFSFKRLDNLMSWNDFFSTWFQFSVRMRPETHYANMRTKIQRFILIL